MRIVIVIGRVLDPRGIVVNRRVGCVFVNREEYVMQPADACVLEAALCIKDGGDVEVVALPRGALPDDAAGSADVLRQALSAGVDRAICFVGRVDSLSHADGTVMAHLLAAAVERLGDVDLILTGATTLDTGQGQLGPRLAEALGWPQIVGAWAVRVLGEHHVEVICRESRGYMIHEADLPAVVTVVQGALKPRYPDGVRLINVYRDADAVEKWDVSELVGEAALKPLVEKRGRDFPPERERGVRLSGSSEEMAQALADALRERVR
jgi:electron transfer flavoprotein beta subunit